MKKIILALVILALTAGFAPERAKREGKVYRPLDLNSPAVVARIDVQADSILRRLTLTEKIRLLATGGEPVGLFTMPVEKAGIAALKTSDASVGINQWGPSTAYPASAALAATWDRKLAYLEGRSVGRDARARGINEVFGPGIDIVREPQCGRNFEYMGEDPYLAGHLAAEWIRGLQSMRVAACAKHFVVNEQETDRSQINEIVGMRALHEIYLPPFRDAVKLGNVMSIMCAYNKVNGQFCTANHYLLTTVLRNRWGFKGQVRSDYGATHDTFGPLTAGLDLENPVAKYYSAQAIMPLLKSRKISAGLIDRHVRRLLRLMIAMNFLHGKQQDDSIPLDDPRSRAIALRVAAEGTVLLKNRHSIMPLNQKEVRSIVMVGPNAATAVTGGGGSSHVTPIHKPVSMVAAIKAVAEPGTKVIDIPYPDDKQLYAKSDYAPFHGAKTLEGTYYQGIHLSGRPVARRAAKQINFNWQLSPPVSQVKGGSQFSVRWMGRIRPKQTGQYLFSVGCDDGSRIYLDGKMILDDWETPHPLAFKSAIVRLTGRKTYSLRVEYYNLGGIAQMYFGWRKLVEISPREAALIRSADVVIACVGPHETEGNDRPFRLPDGQGSYLHDVGLLNPHTIVVVNAGSNVEMSHWIHQVDGLVYAWYPGENGNTAVADILFGKIDPSGRLPDTFARRWKDDPAYGHFPGHNGAVHLAEGIYVGYRWFDKKHIQPRFPFGYGLSYTSFRLGHLTIASSGVRKRRLITVRATVTNIGERSGADVVQLYIHPPQDNLVDRCVQKLEDFARIRLRPGQSGIVSMKLRWRDFAYFDVGANQWKVPAGIYEIAVGQNSRDEPLKGSVQW